jgi:hypothetical protein
MRILVKNYELYETYEGVIFSFHNHQKPFDSIFTIYSNAINTIS